MNRTENMLNGRKCNEKVLIIAKIACTVIVIMLALMQLIGIWDKAIYVFEPLLGILMLIQAIENWKKNEKLAIYSLGAALVLFVCAIIMFVNIVS
jgi:hypothetical protein